MADSSFYMRLPHPLPHTLEKRYEMADFSELGSDGVFFASAFEHYSTGGQHAKKVLWQRERGCKQAGSLILRMSLATAAKNNSGK